MARLAAAVVVVGALLLAPSALALVSEAGSSLLPPTTAPDALPTGVVPASDTGGEVQTVTDAVTCRQAVQVDVHGFGGTGYANQPGHAAFILPYTATGEVTHQVPVYGQVTETVGGLLGLLPSTHTVTEIVGYDTVSEQVSHTFDLAAVADWNEEYIAWVPSDLTFLLTLPAGLPLVAEGRGTTTQVCDPTVDLLGYAPQETDYGFQHWSAVPMADGWYVHLLGLEVHLASADEAASLPTSDGDILCPTDVFDAVNAAAGRLGLDPTSASPFDPLTTGAGGATQLAPSSAGASMLPGGVTTASALGLVALLAAVAGAAVVLRRRGA